MRRLSRALENWPRLYNLVMNARYYNSPKKDRIISKKHDIVIEGFPRSANSFALRAFLHANHYMLPSIATHLHSPVQVQLAAKWNIPVILNIREPHSAVVAWMAFAETYNRFDPNFNIKIMRSWIKEQTLRYIRFYKITNKLSEHYVLADFKETTTNFGNIILRVNKKFNTSFCVFEHTDKNIEIIFANSKAHLSPNKDRKLQKEKYVELYNEPRNAKYRNLAQDIYLTALHNDKLH